MSCANPNYTVVICVDGQPVSATHPIPTAGAAVTGVTPVDAAVLQITSGGTSQEVFAANPNRKFLEIQNLSAEELWYNFGAAANADSPSYRLAPNGVGIARYPQGGSIPVTSVTIFGATTGSRFSAKEG